MRTLAERFDIDMPELCRDQIMNWAEIRTLAADPLVTIGAHTKGHYALAKICEEKAIDQMQGSADVIERELGVRPAHFAFPYGDEESARARDFTLAHALGFKTAVTTRKGVLFPGAPPLSHGPAAGVAQWRIPVARLHGALSLGRAIRPCGTGFQQVSAA